MTNHELIISEIGLLADALVNQEYCESCPYNENGICIFDQQKEGIGLYRACRNAAIRWLRGESE